MRSASDSLRTGFIDPIRLTIGLWLFVIIGAALADLNPLQPAFVLFVAVGVGAHVAGMWFCRLSVKRRRVPVRSVLAREDKAAAWLRQAAYRRLATVLLALLVIGLLYFLAAYSEVVTTLDAAGFLAARNAYLGEVRGLHEKRFLYTTHLTLVGIAAMFFRARAYRDAVDHELPVSRRSLILLAAVTFSIALLTTGRTAPLLAILSFAFYCLRFRVFSKSTILTAFFVVFSLMFFGVAAVLGKEGLGDSNQVDTGEALANLGRIYFFSAPVALQEVLLRGEVVSNACSNVFSYPVDLLKKLNFFANCEPPELDFVFVPVATNVFSFLRAYWEDFGFGYAPAMFMSGVLIELVHRRALDGQGYSAYIFPFVLNAVLLQIFEEQLFANGSVFAYLTLAYFVCRRLSRSRLRLRPAPVVVAGRRVPV